MSRHLSEKKVSELFETFCEKESISFVARKCRVSPQTVRRYRDEENWIDRLEKLREETRQLTDTEIAQDNARVAAKMRKFRDAGLSMFDEKVSAAEKNLGKAILDLTPTETIAFDKRSNELVGQPGTLVGLVGAGESDLSESLRKAVEQLSSEEIKKLGDRIIKNHESENTDDK